MAPRPPQGAKIGRKRSGSAPRALGSRETQEKSPLVREAPLKTKIAKRKERHDSFVNRIAKRATPAKPLKRRRPGNKLAASLSGLVDALPDAESASKTGISDAIELGGSGAVRIRNTSLKSRAGAQKKRAALENIEREWFAKNMASMVTVEKPSEPAATPNDVGDPGQRKWSALKDHIAANLERTRDAQK